MRLSLVVAASAYVTHAFHIGSPTMVMLGSCRLAPSAGRSAAPALMAGFGAPSSKGGKGKAKTKKEAKPAAPKLSMKQQWERFKGLVNDGLPRHPVYARLPDGEWLCVGDVACAAHVGVPSAVQLHKRFILEHATRVSPKLALRSKELVCGYAIAGADDAEPVLLEKVEAAERQSAGFEGAADPSARYAALSNLDAVKKMDEASSTLKMGGF